MSQPRLPDDALRALGDVTADFSQLEFIIRVKVFELLRAEGQKGFIATASLNFGQLLDTLASLYYETYPDSRDRLKGFDDLLGRLRTIGERRNLALHSFWVQSGDGLFGLKIPRGRAGPFGIHRLERKLNDFHELAALARSAVDEVARL